MDADGWMDGFSSFPFSIRYHVKNYGLEKNSTQGQSLHIEKGASKYYRVWKKQYWYLEKAVLVLSPSLWRLETCDVVRYRIHRMKRQLKDELEDMDTLQECIFLSCSLREVIVAFSDMNIACYTSLIKMMPKFCIILQLFIERRKHSPLQYFSCKHSKKSIFMLIFCGVFWYLEVFSLGCSAADQLTDDSFHCENCNAELVAESSKLAAEEKGDGEDNGAQRLHEKLKELEKMEVGCFSLEVLGQGELSISWIFSGDIERPPC